MRGVPDDFRPFEAEGEEVKSLPCKHLFHAECIDQWLLGKGRPAGTDPTKSRGLPTCPLCKAEAVEVAYPEHIAPPVAKQVVAREAQGSSED